MCYNYTLESIKKEVKMLLFAGIVIGVIVGGAVGFRLGILSSLLEVIDLKGRL